MGNSFIFSLDIPVMIDIFYEIITILHEKTLNVIYFYWFHNDTSAENNSLNSHSNEPWINGCRFVISPVKLNLLPVHYSSAFIVCSSKISSVQNKSPHVKTSLCLIDLLIDSVNSNLNFWLKLSIFDLVLPNIVLIW